MITNKWLEKYGACDKAVDWLSTQKNHDYRVLLNNLIDENKPLEWGSWFVSRRLPKIKKVRYAVYAAKQVLHIYEEKHPNGKRPRKAINAAIKYIKSPTKNNKADAAAHAADASYAATYAAASYAAYAAASAAAHAADASAYAAYAAASAAAHASASAYASASAASYAYGKQKLQIKILKYGLKLLNEKRK